MSTAIIGTGTIGTSLARHLAAGGERIILAGRDAAKPQALARELGAGASAAPVATAIADADTVIFAVWFDTMQALIAEHADALRGKVVVDPSNPITPAEGGGFARTLPDGTSGGQVIAARLPADAHFVKAFGSLGAEALASGANRAPARAVLFYATDDARAAREIERLITAAGFEPVKAGGVADALRMEVFGDLHQFGGLNGAVPNRDEATAAVAAATSTAVGGR